ncbi:MAG: 6-phosphofructokinase [Oscillospiraceae bacterium]
MEKVQTIGVLTSGGDAPGMNAAIRSAIRTGLYNNIRMVGIRRGFTGLISGDIFEMNLRSVKDIIKRGGTILYSSRCPEFMEKSGVLRGKQVCEEAGIDGLMVMGGDGSFKGAAALSELGMPCVGIPCTIDNDITSSDYTIGFDTAVNTAVEMVDRIRDTSQSHDRCSVVEVMGRSAGYIALQTGISCGASAILVPEIEPNFDEIAEKINKSLRNGKQHFIIIVAEGVGDSQEITKKIENLVGINTRLSVLGYVQRGGSPSAKDRAMASYMGHYGVELLLNNKANRVVSYKDGKITDFDLKKSLTMKKGLDMELYRISNEISI